jgi:hypothetical protein
VDPTVIWNQQEDWSSVFEVTLSESSNIKDGILPY